MRSSHVVLDQVDIAFDGQRAVASAELLLATLAERLGIEQAADQLVDLGEQPGAARPGRKLLAGVHAPWSPAGTASTTWSCCAADPPTRCFAIG